MIRMVMTLFMIGLTATATAAGETTAAPEAAAVQTGPWIAIAPDARILTMRDVPLQLMHHHPEQYLGTIFEDRFKFFHIYRTKEDMIPDLSRQAIVGETHFTARPVQQPVHVIRIRITPEQDAWLRDRGIRRQDVLKARVRFAGIAPGGALAFDLLEIEESVRSWRLRRTGDPRL